ncbi:LysR family transcriptional regulator [Nonlabens sp. MB-3u-79]|jgi:DNA-binding transcriptional LysR family regulator|uniref:LysR family transcriptional regulator n=1 Tax=Nonlabens sp. MB-3u-79 TaxID=2058134 RepID=UPI000C30A822|nr:LysR family transcriptional regulator [Nonlabens sp. MB-3u-79]AUC79127.1 LysR family transcriptional regulator [Nonlabens sp. MB-3u-79]|tara:strand:- start:26356 stop:27279 length:924 start_codon:yes stop_codon:yes gene_type:complete
MHYTLHQLQIFLQIVEKRSITKASEALFLTQPAVSIQLKKFQDQFPIPLTEVIGRQLYVTDFGDEIANVAQRILEEVQVIDYKTNQYQGKLAGKLKLSIVSTGKYVMPYFLSGFLNEHTGVEFSMDVTNKKTVIQDLEQNKVDFALVSVLPDHLDLDTLPLMKNELYLVGSSDREKNRKGKKELIFSEEPLLYREQGSATRNAMENFIQGKNLLANKKIELTSNEALKQAVIAGIGYSIMPMIGIRNAVEKGEINVIPYKGLPIQTQWNLIWLKKKKLSPAAVAFKEYILENKDQITAKYFDWVVQD